MRASAGAGQAARASSAQTPTRRSRPEHRDEPQHVVLAVHQHDLRGHRRGDRARREREPQDPAPSARGELDERDRARARHRPRARARARRRSRGGRCPWRGSARRPRRANQPPSTSVSPARPPIGDRPIADRPAMAPWAVLGRGLGLRRRSGSPAIGEREQRQAEQPEEGERQHPAGLVAEAHAEQPQRTRGAAEGDRVLCPCPWTRSLRRGRELVSGARGRRGARGVGRLRVDSALAGGGHAGAGMDDDLARATRPGLRRARSRCIRRSARARSCSSSCRHTGAWRRA